jgi:fibronectin type 3 domain-containing protein
LASITIPDSVTSIGDYAFDACSSLTSITIPDSVTSIGDYAFESCSSLTSITIPETVTSIGGYAFTYCSSLTSITIPETVTSIGDSAFCGCKSLASITIPDTVTSIGDYAFAHCSSLTSITIPDSVTSIGNSAFADCSSLTSITIPDTVTIIGKNTFIRCYGLKNITIPDTVTSIGDWAFYKCYSLKSITIPTSVVSISSGAFTDSGIIYAIILSADTEIVDDAFGDDVKFIYAYQHNFNKGDVIAPTDTSIGYTIYTCSDCDLTYYSDYVNRINVYYVSHYGTVTITGLADNSITDLVIPGTIDGLPVTSIGGSAFEGCTGLISITIPDSVTSIGRDAFYGCKSITSIEIPDSVTSIGNSAFWYCESLTSITIPNSVTSIGNSAFYCCKSLTRITIPNSVTSIGDSAFCGCQSLTSIEIPDSVTSIGEYAFCACKSLNSITIPNSVISIGEAAFKASGIEYVIILSADIEIADEAFNDDTTLIYAYLHNFDNGEIIAPTYLTKGYTLYSCLDCDVTYQSDYVNHVEHPIYSGLYYLIIDDEVTITGLVDKSKTELVIPDKIEGLPVTSIFDCAFNECTSLTSITMPDSLISIGDYAFASCTSLTCITIPNSVTSIGNYAFYYCFSLASITIPDSVISIGDGGFYCCSSLSSITIPDSVTSIGERAFYSCISLTSIIIPDSVTSIGNFTFFDCDLLTRVIIPNTVTSIGSCAFLYCSSLTNITIPDSVTSIGSKAFCGCSSLTNITIPDSVTSIGYGVFYKCNSLTSIIIPNSVTSIDDYAFAWCPELTEIIIESCTTSIDEDAFKGCDKLNGNIIIKHKVVTDKAVAATCTKSGLTAGTHCSVCNEVLTAQKTVAALGHNYTSKVTKATYTTKGYTTYTCSRCGDSYKSNYTNMLTLTKPSVKVANTSTGVQVTWSKTTGATGYIVYRKTGSEKWTALKTVTSVTTVSYLDTAAKAGTTYYYTVKAYAGSNKSNKSSFVTDVSIKYLAQPTVTLTNTSTGVKISWTESAGAGGYYVYRKAPGDKKWTLINKASNLSYTDTTAKAGTTYYYTVKAYSGKTYSSYVTDKTIKRLTQPVVTLSNVTKGVKISWKKITGAGGYYVYRKAPGDKKWTLINKASNLSYTDTTAKAGTTYYYTVKAYSGKTYSSYVTDKTIKRLTQPTVTLSNVTKGVKISWKKITGATGYIVYRKTASGSWSRIKTITSASTLSYTDTTGKNGTTYYYTVKAYSGNINSSYVTNKSIKYKK